MGQSSRGRNDSTSDLRDHESCVCRDSVMYVGSPILPSDKYPLLTSLIGRNQEYLNLNLNFAVNAVKFAIIIGMFPKLLKGYVVMS